jgi:hypothetical protein
MQSVDLPARRREGHMKIALAALFTATIATTGAAAFAQDAAVVPTELVPAGVPLRVELDKSYSMKTGTRIQGHLTEPVYLIDHVAIPANSKVYGSITGKHGVGREARTAAMFNGDLTPLKHADVNFDELETPDGRHFIMDTNATERTAKVVRMASQEEDKPRKTLMSRIASAFRWTKQETVATFTAPHKIDTAKQVLYAEIPVHPQELWVGTQFDAELQQPLELAGQAAPALVETANLDEIKLEGNIEARLVDPVDSATATAGMPVEAVLTEPLFEQAPAQAADAVATTTPKAHGRLLLPEGTHLIGSVVQAKAAGMFGHNGSLRFTFRKAELPAGDERVVHGRVIAAETVKSDRLQIDDEGQIKAGSGNRFLAPITLGSLAAVSDNTGATLIHEAMATNGMDLITRVIGTVSSNAGGLVSGFAYYEAGKVVYDSFIARGHEVVFAKNTRMEIELAQR